MNYSNKKITIIFLIIITIVVILISLFVYFPKINNSNHKDSIYNTPIQQFRQAKKYFNEDNCLYNSEYDVAKHYQILRDRGLSYLPIAGKILDSYVEFDLNYDGVNELVLFSGNTLLQIYSWDSEKKKVIYDEDFNNGTVGHNKYAEDYVCSDGCVIHKESSIGEHINSISILKYTNNNQFETIKSIIADYSTNDTKVIIKENNKTDKIMLDNVYENEVAKIFDEYSLYDIRTYL